MADAEIVGGNERIKEPVHVECVLAFHFVASLLLVAMPFVTSSFLLLVVRPGATSSVLAPSSDALCLIVQAAGLDDRCKIALLPVSNTFAPGGSC